MYQGNSAQTFKELVMNTYKVARISRVSLYTLAVVEVQANSLKEAKALASQDDTENRLDSVEQNASETPDHWWTDGLAKAFPRLSGDPDVFGDTTKVFRDK